MFAAAKEVAAVLAALATYQGRVLPQVRRELAAWRERAAALADAGMREIALTAIDEKGTNVEATAVFAILAPRRTRARAARAMVALQVAIDYLDSLGELPSADPLADGLRLHGKLAAAALGGGTPGDYRPRGDSARESGREPVADPHLSELVAAFGESAGALPSHAAVAPALERAIARCGEGQAHTHAAEHGDRAALEAWARTQAAPGIYRWWEVAAGASSSVAAHALIAAAADPRTGPAEAEPIDAAYFPPVGALTVLLDDLVDREEDAATGAHDYLAYYRDGAEAANRLELIARLGRAAIAPLRHPGRHAAILAGVAGYYLSGAEAERPYALPIRDRLLGAAGPAVRPIVAVMRRRRR